jgi:hypothetical protein
LLTRLRGYVILAMPRTEDAAFEMFQRYRALAENQTGHRIKHLRDDKGGNLSAINFINFVTQLGLRENIPYEPLQSRMDE